ncbi:MAG TPA: hypothetical protein VI260_24950 [Blastocatellia bacterium]
MTRSGMASMGIPEQIAHALKNRPAKTPVIMPNYAISGQPDRAGDRRNRHES